MIELIDLGLSFLEKYLGTLKSKVPEELASSLQAAVDGLAKHKNDLITQANLDAQRG